jgi:selenocysteine-specific elongation factor
VIGHVDHGKTALVRALTGIETDRLKEEQERGLSIALGFAYREYPSGFIDFIDAPGHADFIRTAVSGASGCRAALLVVSAVDGFERQTLEHLEIASRLGIEAGVVAATKSDLLSADGADEARTRIERDLAGTALEGQPVVFCSARTGEGLDDLNAALDDLLRRCPPPPRLPGFFLPVDRAFSVRGIGVVVTGTLLGAGVAVGEEAIVAPSGRAGAIRGVQARGADLPAVEAGRRTAVNLRGLSLDEVGPGDVLCAPGRFAASSQLDALLSISPGAARPLKALDDVRLLIGTRSLVATVRLLEGRSIEPGESGLAQLRFTSPVTAFAGQRSVLRRLSPAETIGGAIILDPAPAPVTRRKPARIAVLQAARAGEVPQLASALASRDGGVISLAELARLSGGESESLAAGLAGDFDPLSEGLMASREVLAATEQAYVDALAAAHRRAPARSMAPIESIRRIVAASFPRTIIAHAERRLASGGAIVLGRGRVALASHDPFQALGEDKRARLRELEALLREGGVSPPDLVGGPRLTAESDDLLRLLIETGRAVALENHALSKTLVFHTEALDAAAAVLEQAFPHPAPFRAGEAREVLATTRKFIVPVLEYFDARGWTVRDGDMRTLAARTRHPEAGAKSHGGRAHNVD